MAQWGRLPCLLSYQISPDLTSASGCLWCLLKAPSVFISNFALSLLFTCFVLWSLLFSLSLCLADLSVFLSLFYFMLFSLFGYPVPLWSISALLLFSLLLNEEAKVKSSGSFYRTRRLKLNQKVRAGQNKNKQADIGCQQQALCSL